MPEVGVPRIVYCDSSGWVNDTDKDGPSREHAMIVIGHYHPGRHKYSQHELQKPIADLMDMTFQATLLLGHVVMEVVDKGKYQDRLDLCTQAIRVSIIVYHQSIYFC